MNILDYIIESWLIGILQNSIIDYADINTRLYQSIHIAYYCD